jgi:decaprenylphospho-beta-D-ribofuranose 2-oxidase
LSSASRQGEAPGLPRHAHREISGWGNFPVEACDVFRPERFDELAEIVATTPHASITARGLGRSYGDAALNADGAVIETSRLDRMLAFDEETGVLHCESAVSLADIVAHFLPRGFFFPVTPGTKFITVGGAIAADVHGKNHHFSGSMSAFLIDFRLLTAAGELLLCSREENAEVFWATIGGMGLTGIVVEAQLRLRRVETSYMNAETEQLRNLDHVLERLEAAEGNEYSVAWIDIVAKGASLGRSVLLRANHANLSDLDASLRSAPCRSRKGLSAGLPFMLPSRTVNAISIRAFNEVYYRAHPTRHSISHCDSYFYPLDQLAHWNRAYGRAGAMQYQALVPPQNARETLLALLEELARSKQASFLAVLKTFGASSEGLLSFPRPGYTLSIDLPHTGQAVLDALARLDQIVLRAGGSVYLAKDSCLEAESFAAMYPGLDRFRDVKAKIDPEQRFSSSMARRLQIVEP